ncbi:alpha-galactosidase, partial [bacterium]
LNNPEVLAVNQRSENNRQLWNRNGFIAWLADVPGSRDKYLGLFNTHDNNTLDENRAAFKSDIINRQTPEHGVAIDTDITGAKKLFLVATEGGDNFNADHADWIEPRLVGPKGELKLTDLKWANATAGWGQVSTSIAASGKPMSVNGKPVSYGIATHALSVIEFDLPQGYTRFKSFAALDDGGTTQTMPGSTVRFLVFTKSPYAENTTTPIPVSLQELGFANGAKVRDLWNKKNLGTIKGGFNPVISSHGAALYRIAR